MNNRTEFNKRIEGLITGLYLGHQMGQWSERRYWAHKLPGQDTYEDFIDRNGLISDDRMQVMIETPPFIETPGWGPTGFDDTIPHIAALGLEFFDKQRSLTPEDFKNFLLRERGWLQLQGVGRSCVELMDEGMNPRITGLFAGCVASGCWVAWPVAVYNAGVPDDAYEDAVKLCRTHNGGDIVELSGVIAAACAQALVPGSEWTDILSALLDKISIRNKYVADNIRYSIFLTNEAKTPDELIKLLRSDDYFKRVAIYGGRIDWLQSIYSAIAALEFLSKHYIDWIEWMRLALMLPDTRFGAMICASIYGALYGVDGFDRNWTDTLSNIQSSPPDNRITHIKIRNVVTESRNILCEKWMKRAQSGVDERIYRDLTAAKISLRLSGCDDAGNEVITIGESSLYDRVLAANMAGAAANAMGSLVEDRDYSWLADKYGVVETILDMSRFDKEDDAAMAIMWAETYIERGGRIYPEDLANTFRNRMDQFGFYYDTQVGYQALMQGLAPHACGHWNVVTGSALMGCNSVGVIHVSRPELAANDSIELSYLYQRGFDVYAAGMLCAATAEALTDGATVDSIINAALNAAPKEPLACFNRTERMYAREYFEKVLRAVEGYTDVLKVREILYNYLEYNGQDPWEVIALTLSIFKVANGDPWQAAIGGTNIGRDSDTIACQATFLSVCMTGMAGVPEYYKSLFSKSFIDLHEGLASGLVELVRKRSIQTLKTAATLGIG